MVLGSNFFAFFGTSSKAFTAGFAHCVPFVFSAFVFTFFAGFNSQCCKFRQKFRLLADANATVPNRTF
jgi:hypothetical protein